MIRLDACLFFKVVTGLISVSDVDVNVICAVPKPVATSIKPSALPVYMHGNSAPDPTRVVSFFLVDHGH